METFFRYGVAAFLAILPCNQVLAETISPFSTSAKELTIKRPIAIVKKKEVIPGKLTFNRQNGCSFQSPISKIFLEDGTTLETPVKIAISGNNIPKWRSELKKPWQSKLTDYQSGEYKVMLLRIGQHPPRIIKIKQSNEQLLNVYTACNIASHYIFQTNQNLLKPIYQPRENVFSLSMNDDWTRYFSNYSDMKLSEVNKTEKIMNKKSENYVFGQD